MTDETLPLDPKGEPERALPGRIGPYRMLDLLGEGGMGRVYIAEQTEPVRRRVAVKVIRLGMDSEEVLTRFAAEQQALAMMEHDSIAKVHDAGITERGQPYFAMEYVSGKPITEYCDENQLSTRDRLKLFQQVCAGVQHAHQKGIIHRDLKPSNVLVTWQQDRAVPKIIDFGIAKATDHRLDDATMLTAQGFILGTPEYMSPEQTSGSSDIDTRTDIYSLGVILYELLVGELPFSSDELPRGDLAEIQRKIRNVEPPRPSTRFVGLGPGTGRSAQQRKTTAASLVRELKGDLDWVVMRAMEKDRNRRYATPVGLAEDIDRYLRHEPVLAGPPSNAYRLKKFLRRYRLQVVAAGAVFVTLVAGIVGTSMGLGRAAEEAALKTAEAERALFERGEAEGLTNFLLFDLRDRLAPIGRLDLLEEVALRAKAYYDNRSEGDLSDDARRQLAAAWSNIGYVLQNQGVLEEAASSYASAVDIGEELMARDPSDATLKSNLAASYGNLGEVRYSQGDLEGALESVRTALRIQEDVLREDPPDAAFQRRLGAIQNTLGAVLQARGDLDGALQSHRSAVEILEDLVVRDSDPDLRSELAGNHTSLGLALQDRGDSDAALESFLRAQQLLGELVQADPSNSSWRTLLAASARTLGSAAQDRGDLEGAVSHFESAVEIFGDLVAKDPTNAALKEDLALAQVNLGILVSAQGHGEEAAAGYRSAIGLLEDLVDQDPSNAFWQGSLAGAHDAVGFLLEARGDTRAAVESHERAIAILRDLVMRDPDNGSWRSELATSVNNLGTVLGGRGDGAGALRRFQEAMRIRQDLVARDPSNTTWKSDLAASHVNLGVAAASRGEMEVALESFRNGVGILEEIVEREPTNAVWREDLAMGYNNLGSMLLEGRGDLDAALAMHEQALEAREALVLQDPTNVGWKGALAQSHYNMAILRGQREVGPSIVHYRRALEVLAELVALEPANPDWQTGLGQTTLLLAGALYDAARYEESAAAFSRALTNPEYRSDLDNAYLYNAACSAALAAAATEGEAARELQSQALQWLGEDLQMRAARIAELEAAIVAGVDPRLADPARAELQEHREQFEWARTGDADLASLRGLAAFTELFDRHGPRRPRV